MKKLLFITLLLTAPFFAYAEEEGPEIPIAGLDFSKMSTLLSSNCNDASLIEDDINQLEELSNQEKVYDFSLYFAGSYMGKVTDFTDAPECQKALVEVSISLLDHLNQYIENQAGGYIEHGGFAVDNKKELALSLMKAATFETGDTKAQLYSQADILIEDYLKAYEILDYENTRPDVASNYYFAAHAYMDAAEMANLNQKIILLQKAYNVAYSNKSQLSSESLLNQLNEPIGVALIELARTTKGRDEELRQETLHKAIEVFSESHENGNELAAYNVVSIYSLLEDISNAKKWMEILKENDLLSSRVCNSGFKSDDDMEWLRKNHTEFLDTYLLENCPTVEEELQEMGALLKLLEELENSSGD